MLRRLWAPGGVERVYRRNGDKELLNQCLGPLERFHDWFWRERDLHDNGLITDH